MDKRIPIRTCIGCNRKSPKEELLRIVRKPDGIITIDEADRMSGRGAYLCMDRNCYEAAVRKKSLNRVFKTAVSDEDAERLGVDFIKAYAGRRQCET